jgi:hypothetical protein
MGALKMHDDTSSAARRVPGAALCARVGEFQLAADDAGAKTAPIRLVARSGKPIEHWYFGKVVHDLDGMRFKGRVPIDYVHDDKEVIGYVNRFDTSSGDLNLAGALVPFNDDDRAAEVAYKARNGVPYEASIDFRDQMTVEELRPGQSAEVNGEQVDGPATIIREWTLRGVAVCPYGADPNTSSQLSSVEQFTVSVTKGHAMNSNNNHSAAPRRGKRLSQRLDEKFPLAAQQGGKRLSQKLDELDARRAFIDAAEHDDDAPTEKREGKGFTDRIRFGSGAFRIGRQASDSGEKGSIHERRMVRHALFSVSAATAMAEAAENLGLKLSDLNEDQRQLLVTMADRPLTRRQRLAILADAE